MTIPKPFLQIVAAVVFIHGCAAGPTRRSAPATLESEIRERSRLLAAAEAAKDFETAVSFWMPDAVIHLEGAETIRGLSAIRDTYEHFFKTVLSFAAKMRT